MRGQRRDQVLLLREFWDCILEKMTPTSVRKRGVGVPDTAQGKTSATERTSHPSIHRKSSSPAASGGWDVEFMNIFGEPVSWIHIIHLNILDLSHLKTTQQQQQILLFHVILQPLLLFAVLNLIKNCSYLLSIFCPPLIPQCNLTLLPPWIPHQNHVH